MVAVGAGLDVSAKGSSATMLDRRHDRQLVQTQVPGMDCSVIGARAAEDIGDLE